MTKYIMIFGLQEHFQYKMFNYIGDCNRAVLLYMHWLSIIYSMEVSSERWRCRRPRRHTEDQNGSNELHPLLQVRDNVGSGRAASCQWSLQQAVLVPAARHSCRCGPSALREVLQRAQSDATQQQAHSIRLSRRHCEHRSFPSEN